MYRKRKSFIFFPLVIIALILLLGWVVMLLWNAILPAAVHANPLNYWQATGLLILSRILVGGWGGRGGRGHGRRGNMPGREKWMSMNDEEKQAFKEQWKKRCGPSA